MLCVLLSMQIAESWLQGLCELKIDIVFSISNLILLSIFSLFYWITRYNNKRKSLEGLFNILNHITIFRSDSCLCGSMRYSIAIGPGFDPRLVPGCFYTTFADFKKKSTHRRLKTLIWHWITDITEFSNSFADTLYLTYGSNLAITVQFLK